MESEPRTSRRNALARLAALACAAALPGTGRAAPAGLLERGSQRAELRAFAASIVRTQSAEVAQMNAWLATWYPGRDTRVDHFEQPVFAWR